MVIMPNNKESQNFFFLFIQWGVRRFYDRFRFLLELPCSMIKINGNLHPNQAKLLIY